MPAAQPTTPAELNRILRTGGELDTPSRQLARYIVRVADTYFPNLDVQLIYRLDRYGRGVHLDLRSQEEVAAAFPAAQAEARRGTVLVESYVAGNDYRVLVVGGRMVAIAERVPAHVVGDGAHTVAQLVTETCAPKTASRMGT